MTRVLENIDPDIDPDIDSDDQPGHTQFGQRRAVLTAVYLASSVIGDTLAVFGLGTGFCVARILGSS